MHEPNDVTVELDGPGRRLSERPAGTAAGADAGTAAERDSEAEAGREPDSGRSAGAAAAVRADRSDGPVFVDASGRRSKKFRRAGWAVAIVCACYSVTVVIALIGGNSSAPWLQIPGLVDKKKPDTVQIQPAPTTSPSVRATTGPPAVLPSATESRRVVPLPSGSAATGTSGTPVPSTSGSAKSPTASTSPGGDPDPEPGTSTGSGTAPGGGTAGPGDQSGSATPTDDISPSADESPDPSSSPGDEDPLAAGGAQ